MVESDKTLSKTYDYDLLPFEKEETLKSPVDT